jgi:peptide/nickel transport system substrate-binding protein
MIIGVVPAMITVILGRMRAWVLAACLLVALPPAARTDDTLRIGVYSLPRGLGNPHSSTAGSEMNTWAAIFDSLTRIDANAQVVPWLATRWEPLDELTWRFELRRDVTFSNGEPFDAAAVVAALDYLMSDEAAGESVAREFAVVAAARAVNEFAVEVTTSSPVIILPALMASLRIPAPGQWARLGPRGFARKPVGSGPYRVENWTAARVDLVPFADSWRAPMIRSVEINEVLDPSARLQGLQAGQLDIVLALTADDVPVIEGSGATAYVDSGAGVSGLSFITVKEGPLQDVRVRQALNYAVDKEAIVNILLGGHTRPAGQPAPHNGNGYNPAVAPYPYDPAKAKALLAEAGYPDGFAFLAEVVPSGPTVPTPMYGILAQQLAQVGVNMEVRAIPTSQIIIKAVTGTFEGTAFSMEFDFAPTLDPQRALGMHSCLRAVPWHCDENVMPLIEASRNEFDEAKRRAILREIMQVYHDTAPMLYLYESVHFDGVSARVRNYRPINRVIPYEQLELAE